MQTINWNDFNALKQDAFDAKTEEQWQTVKHRYEEMAETYDEETRKYFKEKTVPQLQTLYEKKKAYWEKLKQHPTILRNNFIFQDGLAEALTEYIRVKTELMKQQACLKLSQEWTNNMLGRPLLGSCNPPAIASNGEGGQLSHPQGESSLEGASMQATETLTNNHKNE